MTRGIDLTRRAVAGWLAALPAPLYDLRLVPAAKEGRVHVRRLDAAGMLAALPWVRALNAAGRHAYARPAGGRHVLVDDLSAEAVAAVRRDHAIAAVVETSPGSHQAWITLSADEVATEVAAAAARLLAARYGGDPGAASAAQLGRLPGLTNRKERHAKDGHHPFALLRHALPGVDPAGVSLLAEAAMEARAAAGAVDLRSVADLDACAEMQQGLARLRAALPPGAVLDRSRADYAIARRQLARGATIERAAAVVLAGERAREMPSAAALAYAARTARAAALDLARCPPASKGMPASPSSPR